MIDFEQAFQVLDGQLSPELEGTLAAVSLAAAAFVLSPRSSDGSSSLFSSAGNLLLLGFMFFLFALIVDLGVGPFLLEPSPENADFADQDLAKVLGDTISQVALFGIGLIYLFLGSLSIMRTRNITIEPPSPKSTTTNQPGRALLSELQLDILEAANKNKGITADCTADKVGGVCLERFEALIKELVTVRYLEPINGSNYRTTEGGKRRLKSEKR